jgi:hypothetical protein
LEGVRSREWEFEGRGTEYLLIGSRYWELRRVREGELRSSTPLDIFRGESR